MIADNLIRAVMHAKITEGEFFWIEKLIFRIPSCQELPDLLCLRSIQMPKKLEINFRLLFLSSSMDYSVRMLVLLLRNLTKIADRVQMCWIVLCKASGLLIGVPKSISTLYLHQMPLQHQHNQQRMSLPLQYLHRTKLSFLPLKHKFHLQSPSRGSAKWDQAG